MNRLRKFINNNYKIILALIALLVVSFLIYYFVFAEDDEYANNINVSVSSVDIKDGTPNSTETITDESGNETTIGHWDENDNPGNDSSDNNKIVRNFDSIKYTIKYTLGFKSQAEGTPSGRKVDIDIALPKELDVKVSTGLDSEMAATKDDKQSDGLAHYTLEDLGSATVGTESEIAFYIYNINSTNNTQIKPTIKIKESTDDFSNVSAVDNVDAVKVSAVDRLGIKLYKGTIKKDDNLSTVPVGLLLYIPKSDVEGKGIKGVSIPSSFEADLSITSDKATEIKYIENVDNIKNKEGELRKYTVSNLPFSYDNNNGKMGYEENNGQYKLKFTELKYNNSETNLNADEEDKAENMVTYISSKIFAISSEKSVSEDINLNFTVSKDNNNLDSIVMVDNYEKYVGKYLSKIDFIDESNISVPANEEIKFTTPGGATYNYGENFYIQDTITLTDGDPLESGLTNYIKIDNDLIRLIDVDIPNASGTEKGYYISMSASNENQKLDNVDFEVQYGVGSWEPSNFKLKDNKPSYCPKSLANLTKEQLMNYYGGPCIEEKEDSIKWYNSIGEATEKGDIMIFKFDFKDTYYPGTDTIIRLQGQVKSNVNNINNTAQITSRGVTNFNGDYYLSETQYKSVSEQDSDLAYIKTQYDPNTKEIIAQDSPSGKYGNTILVTPFKASISKIVVKDNNDSEKEEIYSGMNDPMSIEITPVLYKSDSNATFSNAKVIVYLPVELELSIEKDDKMPISTNKTQDGLYNELVYNFTEDEIKYGEQGSIIPNLKLHAYVDISLSVQKPIEIKSVIDATLKPNIDAVTTYNSNTPVSYRTSTKSITVYNTKTIGTLGKVTPSYFERNQSMTYNMRVSNVSGEPANLEIIKVLPFKGDSVSDGSNFDGSISVRIAEALPTGYNVYYTKDSAKTIINNELSSAGSNKWTLWTNYTTDMSGITAIRITTDANTTVPNSAYFANPNGINLIMTTHDNKEGDEYYNNFFVIHHHKLDCDPGIEGGCPATAQDKVPYASNISYSSVYNRNVSGFVFEDYDYDGIYSTGENRLKDIIVELYKLSNTQFDKNSPLTAISDNDQKVADTVTNKNGSYKFKGLQEGNYYVKYTFDCEKYTVTQKNKIDQTLGSTTEIDSDADMLSGTCSAVSNIITVNNENISEEYINLGLRIRQNFDVNIKKYITNVTVNSNKGKQSYDYNNETKVKIDVKNLKNTTFRVTYKFEIENSKYFPGTIGSIIETIPDGMTFDPSLPENDGWYESGGFLYYANYAKTFILPDEKYYMTIVLDLKTDSGGDFVNFVAAQDLKIMETTTNLLEGIQITNYDPTLDKPIGGQATE